jgi:hypothetical protein
MRTLRLILSAPAIITLVYFSSCDRPNVWIETLVYPDGRLDKSFFVKSSDSTKWDSQFYLSKQDIKNWEEKISIDTSYYSTQVTDSVTLKIDSTKHTTYRNTLYRSFRSVEEANRDLATPNDTLFRITSSFEKKFRWFYTYIKYIDTYQPVWRLDCIKDSLTQEDYDFIAHSPSVGKGLSKMDSIHLDKLNEKFSNCLHNALFDIFYDGLVQLIKVAELGDHWVDTLHKHKKTLHAIYLEDNHNDLEKAIVSLGIPIPNDSIAIKQYEKELRQSDTFKKFKNIDLYLKARDRDHIHKIKMPWKTIYTNADSVSGTELYWMPRDIKFLATNYSMYAESRKMNYWAIVVTGLVTGLLVYWLLRKLTR